MKVVETVKIHLIIILLKVPKFDEIAVSDTHTKKVLKVQVMVNKHKKVGWLGATTIHQMKSWRLYTQDMPLQQNTKKTHYCIIV